jgi:hypothetical protein
MTSTNREQAAPQAWWFVPAAVAPAYFALHLLTATHYGYFRDALYYLACAEHLDWGYVDHPPLVVLLAWAVRHTLGTSLPALLIWPALAGCARIMLTAAFARELGAQRFGTALAAVLAAVPGVWWVEDHQFAMNAFEPLLWTGCAFVLLRMIKTENPRLWLAFGAIAGVGLENKYSIAVVAFALLTGLLLTPQRKLLFTPWLLAGGGVALLIFLPNLLWNIQHHWPFFELMHNIRASGRDVVLPPPTFIAQQILLMNPMSLPFWLGGLLFYLWSPNARAYRAFGWAFVITIGFFMVAHGKNYYSAPVYPMVFAAGGVVTELFLTASGFRAGPRLRVTLQTAAFAWLLVGVLTFMPIVLPVLPVDAYLRYQDRLPFEIPRSENGHMAAALPQHYADEFGWPEMVAAAARVYHSLPEEEREKAVIYTDNYGEAAAIDLFGPRYGLPKAICPNQSYFLWGPGNHTGEVMILIGAARADEAKRSFESVEVAARLDNPYAIPMETRPILLCRGLKTNLQALWPQLKDWD